MPQNHDIKLQGFFGCHIFLDLQPYLKGKLELNLKDKIECCNFFSVFVFVFSCNAKLQMLKF